MSATSTTLYFTENDHKRLCSLLDQTSKTSDPRLQGDLRRLGIELNSANLVKPEEIPADVVTLNSKVLVVDQNGDEETWQLTFPADADVLAEKISILSPLGIALLGSRKGQTVRYETERYSGEVTVKEILYQPEAAGNFDL